jgi:hypothetical protein
MLMANTPTSGPILVATASSPPSAPITSSTSHRPVKRWIEAQWATSSRRCGRRAVASPNGYVPSCAEMPPGQSLNGAVVGEPV